MALRKPKAAPLPGADQQENPIILPEESLFKPLPKDDSESESLPVPPKYSTVGNHSNTVGNYFNTVVNSNTILSQQQEGILSQEPAEIAPDNYFLDGENMVKDNYHTATRTYTRSGFTAAPGDLQLGGSLQLGGTIFSGEGQPAPIIGTMQQTQGNGGSPQRVLSPIIQAKFSSGQKSANGNVASPQQQEFQMQQQIQCEREPTMPLSMEQQLNTIEQRQSQNYMHRQSNYKSETSSPITIYPKTGTPKDGENSQKLSIRPSGSTPFDQMHPAIIALREELEIKENQLLELLERTQTMQQSFEQAFELAKRQILGASGQVVMKTGNKRNSTLQRKSENLGTLIEDEDENKEDSPVSQTKKIPTSQQGTNYLPLITKLLDDASSIQKQNRELLTENLHILKDIQKYVHK